jgi:hypothetical protein
MEISTGTCLTSQDFLHTSGYVSAECGQFETAVLSSPAEAAWVVIHHLSLTSKVRYG